MPSFTIQEFDVDDNVEDEMFTVGVAEQPNGGGVHFLFTASEDDLEDAEQDMDSYCITNEGGWCTYGGVTEAHLAGDVLRLSFTDEAARELVLSEPVVEMTLALPSAEREQVKEAFLRVFSFGRESFRPALTGEFATS